MGITLIGVGGDPEIQPNLLPAPGFDSESYGVVDSFYDYQSVNGVTWEQFADYKISQDQNQSAYISAYQEYSVTGADGTSVTKILEFDESVGGLNLHVVFKEASDSATLQETWVMEYYHNGSLVGSTVTTVTSGGGHVWAVDRDGNVTAELILLEGQLVPVHRQ